MVKSARPLLVIALLAVIGAWYPELNRSPGDHAGGRAAGSAAADDGPADGPSRRALSRPQRAETASQNRQAGHKKHKVVKRTHTKTVKVATKHHHKKKHHAKTAHATGHAKHATTRLASRAKPAPMSVPLDLPAPVMRQVPVAVAPGPLTPGLR